MGWISDRAMKTGHSIGTGPKGGKHKGPLRKIQEVLSHGRSLFEPDRVLLECEHEGLSYGGGSQARCKTCGEQGDLSWTEWHRQARQKASSELGLRGIPRDIWREHWLAGDKVHEAVEQVRLRFDGGPDA